MTVRRAVLIGALPLVAVAAFIVWFWLSGRQVFPDNHLQTCVYGLMLVDTFVVVAFAWPHELSRPLRYSIAAFWFLVGAAALHLMLSMPDPGRDAWCSGPNRWCDHELIINQSVSIGLKLGGVGMLAVVAVRELPSAVQYLMQRRRPT